MVLNQDIQQKLEKHREEKAETKKEETNNSVQKFTNDELDTISTIKRNYDNITLRMGQLHFELQSLTTEKDNLESAFTENRSTEVEFAKSLTEKYGKGSLDIETGIFTPSE
jgi:chromosome segregation ATPase